MANSGGRRQPARRSGPAIAAVAAVGLLIAACGGGSGGGGGDQAFTLRLAFTNETADTASVQLNSGETQGEPQEVESCKARVLTFPMPETEWVVTVNGETAIDSLEYQPNELDNDVAARLTLNEDDTLTLESFLPGSNVNAPPALGICT
jgi:hypothetical protein